MVILNWARDASGRLRGHWCAVPAVTSRDNVLPFVPPASRTAASVQAGTDARGWHRHRH